MINEELTSDKIKIAEAFNRFYTSIAPDLANKIPSCNKSPTSYIGESNPETISIIPVTEDEVNKIIHGLKDSSPGWDGICTKVVKPTRQQILPILTHLFNLSIARGVFPKEFKTGKVVPIYKNDNCMVVNNFRPVSVLPFFKSLRKTNVF